MKSQREREGGEQTICLLRRKFLYLFHSAGRPAIPSGPHELHRRGPLAENGVSHYVQPVYFHQHGGMTQPGDPETRARLGEVWVLDEVRLHHRQLGIQNLWREEGEARIQLGTRGLLAGVKESRTPRAAHLFTCWHVAVVFVQQEEPEQGGVGGEPPRGPGVGPAAVLVPAGLGHFLLRTDDRRSATIPRVV